MMAAVANGAPQYHPASFPAIPLVHNQDNILDEDGDHWNTVFLSINETIPSTLCHVANDIAKSNGQKFINHGPPIIGNPPKTATPCTVLPTNEHSHSDQLTINTIMALMLFMFEATQTLKTVYKMWQTKLEASMTINNFHNLKKYEVHVLAHHNPKELLPMPQLQSTQNPMPMMS